MPEFNEMICEAPTVTVVAVAAEESTLWQKIMDEAYEFWSEKGGKYNEFIERLSYKQKVAVLLGNLNYQVGNGGFQQWVDNGYALHGKSVVLILRDVAKSENCPIALELADKVTALIGFVDLEMENRGWSDYWLEDSSERGYYSDDDEEEDEDDYHEGREYAKSLDDWYYETVTPLLHPAVDAFLSKM